eukprot:3571566-Prymnesium_polylepis.1
MRSPKRRVSLSCGVSRERGLSVAPRRAGTDGDGPILSRCRLVWARDAMVLWASKPPGLHGMLELAHAADSILIPVWSRRRGVAAFAVDQGSPLISSS